jgi:hypothetical protein
MKFTILVQYLLKGSMLLLFTEQEMKLVLHWVANRSSTCNYFFFNSIVIFVSVHVLLGFQLLVVLDKFNGGCVLDITLRTNSFLWDTFQIFSLSFLDREIKIFLNALSKCVPMQLELQSCFIIGILNKFEYTGQATDF